MTDGDHPDRELPAGASAPAATNGDTPADGKPADPPSASKSDDPAGGSRDSGGEAGAGAEAPSRLSPRAMALSFVVAVVFYGSIFLALAYNFNWFGLGESNLELAARLVPEGQAVDSAAPPALSPGDSTLAGDSLSAGSSGPTSLGRRYRLVGRVLYEGAAPDSARIWAVLRSDSGDEYAPPPDVTDRAGSFDLGVVPADMHSFTAHVSARAVLEPGRERSFLPDRDAEVREAEVTLGRGQRATWALPIAQFGIVLIVFVLSIIAGLIPPPDDWVWRAVKYLTSVMFALLVTILVLYYLSAGLVRVQDTVTLLPDGGSIQLGFATIFKGTYVESVPHDWIFSLTSAPAADVPVAEGLGAPLWALLLSVVGAALFTISLVVGGVLENLRSITQEQVRQKVQLILLHEFYVVFAPVGAILVYQMLVAAGMANEPATVGVVLLASGVGLNLIMNKALKEFPDIMGIRDPSGLDAGRPSGPVTGGDGTRPPATRSPAVEEKDEAKKDGQRAAVTETPAEIT